jgi:hypothetical protein
MITAIIKDKGKPKQFQVKTEWSEVTWKDACDILAVPLPIKVENEITFEQWITAENIHEYAREIVFILGYIPKRLIEQVNPADMLDLFLRYHLKFVVDLLSINPQSYFPKFTDKITFKGVEYRMPKSLMIDNTITPMHEMDAVTFVEAANVLKAIGKLKEEGIKHMHYFTAIYLRPEGEKYDEQKIAARAKLFEELTMDVYWEVFFCTHQLLTRQLIDTLQSLRVSRVKRAILALKVGFMRLRKRASQVRFVKLRS